MAKRRFVLIGFVFLLLIGVGGCMKEKPKNVNTAALEYLEQKYGEPFEYARPWGDSFGGTRQFLTSCESLPEPVMVEIENYRTDAPIFRDNFLAVKYKDQTAEFLRECAAAEFGEATVFYGVAKSAMPETLAVDADFETYLAECDVTLAFRIEVPQSRFTDKEQVEKVTERIAASGLHFNFMVVVVADDAYGTYDASALADVVTLRTYSSCAQITNYNDEIKINWREGA